MNAIEWKDYLRNIGQPEFRPYTSSELEQAFWHFWTLNCYHITLSFDCNMVLLLDWALQFHLDGKK